MSSACVAAAAGAAAGAAGAACAGFASKKAALAAAPARLARGLLMVMPECRFRAVILYRHRSQTAFVKCLPLASWLTPHGHGAPNIGHEHRTGTCPDRR